MKGLRNLGNTCYINAALQCLAFTPALANYFSSSTYKGDVSRKRMNASALCDEFAGVLHTYWKTTNEPNPQPLIERFSKCHRTFNVLAQHDIHEFIHLFLGSLHAGLAKTKRFAAPSDAVVDVEAWTTNNAAHGYSFLTEVFQSQVVVRMSDSSDVHYEHDWGFSLAIDGVSSVAGALARHLGDEELASGSLDGRMVRISRRVVHAPLVLVLHLKRFDNTTSKIEKFVDYGTDLTMPGTATRYSLYAVACHTGSSDSGHYWAMCEVMGSWYRVNDESSTKLDDINTVVTRDAYMLFYKRMS